MSEPRHSDKVLAALEDMQTQYDASPKMAHEEMVQAMSRAIELGKRVERERIIKLLNDWAERFDSMRPKFYKDVAQKADLRVRTIQAMVEEIRREQK